MEKKLQKDASAKSRATKPHFTRSIWTERDLLKRLGRNSEAREKFVESQISNGISSQIRSLRKQRQWSQPKLAAVIGTTQNQIYRLERPETAKPTISTLKRIAAVFDVALIVRFVPFSQLIAWASGTTFADRGLSTSFLRVSSFESEYGSAASVQAEPDAISSDHFWQALKTLVDVLSKLNSSGQVIPINKGREFHPQPSDLTQQRKDSPGKMDLAFINRPQNGFGASVVATNV